MGYHGLVQYPGCQVESLQSTHVVLSLLAHSYLLIVEKDAVFQRLSEDRIFDVLPIIIVTARGMPDMGTRAFCGKLAVGAKVLGQHPALYVHTAELAFSCRA